MEQRAKQSKKRIKLMILIILLMLVMLITTTYAWFSVQRDVEIYGLKVNVEVAENLQISLDGEKWTSTIEIKDMKQLYGTAAKDNVYQSVKNEHANYIPIQLLPVSTIGNIGTDGRIIFAQGSISGKTLRNITLCSEVDIVPGALIKGEPEEIEPTIGMEDNNSNHPYLVFDMYLRNLSKASEDILELNVGSIVTATGTQTGLEASVRIGFLAYDDDASLTEEPEVIRTLGTGREVEGVTQATTGEFAIWEPNYNQHTAYVVANDTRVTNLTSEYKTLPLNTNSKTLEGKTITNVQDDLTNQTEGIVATAYVNRPTQAEEDVEVDEELDIVAVTKGETTEKIELQTVESTQEYIKNLKIGGNKITKLRVYLWLEGQDPDCVDLASTGEQVNATIKLTKEKNEEEEIEFEGESIAFSKIIWKENKASVYVKNNSALTMQYQIVGKDEELDTEGTWETITEKISLVENLEFGNKLVVRLYDETNGPLTYATCIITDAIKPEITLTEVETTTKSIEVLAIAEDGESGLSTSEPYKFYISQSIGEFSSTPVGTSTDGTYIFNNLETNTIYYIKVQKEDIAGNIGEKIIKSQTKLLPSAEQNIVRTIKWQTDGTAQITLTTETEFEILTSTDRSTWKKYTGTINANNGDIIYICLTDGKNKGEDYALKIEDTQGPEIIVTKTASTSNSITVKVEAQDEESGIKKYKYSISYKDFSASDFTETDILSEVECYGNTYVFEELIQNQVYYIKIEVINGVGLSNSYTEQIKTNALNVQENPTELEKVYGKDGEGVAYFVMEEELQNEGYYIEYQIIKEGQSLDEDSTWQQGDIVKGLSVGDTIYTRVNDGKNNTGYYKTADIQELETYSEVYESTQIYKDYDITSTEDGEEIKTLVGEAYIPAGFKVGTSTLNKKIENGLVIEDELGNQYVWIPMDKDKVIYDGVTTLAQSGNSSTYKPLARYQSGYSSATAEQYFEGILYNYSGTSSYVQSTSTKVGTSGYREPSLVTGSEKNYSWVFSSGTSNDATNYTQLSELGINNANEMGQYINNSFNQMVASVAKYGGFYVGRYETSIWTADTWAEGGTNSDNTGTIIKSVTNATTMANMNWYKMYLNSDSNYSSNPYKTSTSVNSSMIWGCQYDAMLNYILEGSDKTKVTAVTGNHTGTRAKTGQYPTDIMNNIFDLSSNVREWTQEACSTGVRTFRGNYYTVTDTTTASYRNTYPPTYGAYRIGSRLTLYLK